MATIEDVARASGVSAATVSYVINNGPRAVRPQTRQRVLRAIEELGYEPSAVARGLRRKRMNALGVVFPHAMESIITNPYFAPILDGIIAVAKQAGQNITLFTGDIWLEASHSLPIYGDGRCDGLLLIAPPLNSDIVAALKTRKLAFIVIDDRSDDPTISSIDIDDERAARELVTYLFELGHRRIAFLPGSYASGSALRRLAGYRRALEMKGVAIDETLIVAGHYNEQSGYERAATLLRRPAPDRPTALFCGNDEIALGALRAASELGIEVPGDLSIVGFDDTAIAAASCPPLTTVRQPLRDLGERAAAVLLAQIEGKSAPGHKELLRTEMILRGSAGSPPY